MITKTIPIPRVTIATKPDIFLKNALINPPVTAATNRDIYPKIALTNSPMSFATIAAKTAIYPETAQTRPAALNATIVANQVIYPRIAQKKMAPILKCFATTARLSDTWRAIAKIHAFQGLDRKRIAPTDQAAAEEAAITAATGDAPAASVPVLTACLWDQRPTTLNKRFV